MVLTAILMIVTGCSNVEGANIKNNGTTTMNFKTKYPNRLTLANDTFKPNEIYVIHLILQI